MGRVAMKYRVFPGTSVRVSEVGVGTWTIYDAEQLAEFAEAAGKRDLSATEMTRIAAPRDQNVGVVEEPMNYKGTMERRAPSLA